MAVRCCGIAVCFNALLLETHLHSLLSIFFFQILMCPEHEMERVNMYCEICRRPVCHLCKLGGSHANHRVTTMSTAYKTLKVKVNVVWPSLKNGKSTELLLWGQTASGRKPGRVLGGHWASREACCCATSVNVPINMTWHMPEKAIVYSMVAEA